MADPKVRERLRRVAKSRELKDDVRANMKTFVLSHVYGDNAHITCVQVRASQWHKLKQKSTIHLHPDDDSGSPCGKDERLHILPAPLPPWLGNARCEMQTSAPHPPLLAQAAKTS